MTTFYEDDFIIVKPTKKIQELYNDFHGDIFKVLMVEEPVFSVMLIFSQYKSFIGHTYVFNLEDFQAIEVVSKGFVANIIQTTKDYLSSLRQIRKTKSKTKTIIRK